MGEKDNLLSSVCGPLFTFPTLEEKWECLQGTLGFGVPETAI